MNTVRRRRLLEHGWYACYLAALVMSLSLWQPSDAHAWCNTFGSSDCGQVGNPCPYPCDIVNTGSDFYDPDSGCGGSGSNMCRVGTCYFYERWGGMCAYLCYYQDYSHCVY
jgi:hypothetical protein